MDFVYKFSKIEQINLNADDIDHIIYVLYAD